MRHVIIDVLKFTKFLTPDKFLDMFQSKWAISNGWDKLEHAKLLYTGKYSGQLVEDIRNNKFKVNEGAVIKGAIRDHTYMVKVKTNAYMERLKTEFNSKFLNPHELHHAGERDAHLGAVPSMIRLRRMKLFPSENAGTLFDFMLSFQMFLVLL